MTILPWEDHPKIVASDGYRNCKDALQLCGVRVLSDGNADAADSGAARSLADMKTTLGSLKMADELLLALGAAAGDVETIPHKRSKQEIQKKNVTKDGENVKNGEDDCGNSSSKADGIKSFPTAGVRGRDTDSDSDDEDPRLKQLEKRRKTGGDEFVAGGNGDLWQEWTELREAVARTWHTFVCQDGMTSDWICGSS
jgi:hypothetical protein